MPEKCPRCGSDKVMEDVRLRTEGFESAGGAAKLLATVHSDPRALLFKGTVTGTLRGRVCGGCGYTEIYTTNFEQLYEAYRKSRGS
jgi:predicted nucleic-acid-binding Zn-ribbon protein